MPEAELKDLISILKRFCPNISENVVLETDSAYLINASPHQLRFNDNTTLQGSIELAKVLKATPKETPIMSLKSITLVKTDFETTPEGSTLIQAIKEFNKKSSKPALLISSIISVQAYGFPVVSPITTPETSRLPPQERIVFKNKFNTIL